MKKFIRAILSVIVGLVVLAIVGVVGAALLTNAAVKKAVERAGTRTLDVPVHIEKAKASLLSGLATLQKMEVANPEGYEGPLLMTLRTVDVAADSGSLLRDTMLIHEMRLDGMEVFVEQNGLQNNLYEVIEPLRRPHEPTGKSLVIDKLTIDNIVVHVAMPSLTGQSQGKELRIAPITMTDLGRHEPMDTTLLISKVVLAVAAGVAEEGGGILPQETIGEISGVLDKAIDIGRIIFGGGKKSEDK